MFLNSYRRRLRSAALMRGIVTGNGGSETKAGAVPMTVGSSRLSRSCQRRIRMRRWCGVTENVVGSLVQGPRQGSSIRSDSCAGVRGVRPFDSLDRFAL